MKKRIIALLLAVLMIGALVSCQSGGKEEETEKERTPDFYVFTEKMEKVSLYKKLGKPVVVNFWATWCPPCKSEMPAFDKLYSEYGEEVEFMMINLTDGKRDTVSGVKAFIAQNGYSFPVYYDAEMNATNTYSVQSIPMTLFIDADGVLINYRVGAMTEDELRTQIEKMVGEGK